MTGVPDESKEEEPAARHAASAPAGDAPEAEAAEPNQETPAPQAGAEKPPRKAKPSGAKSCLLGCLGLVLMLIVTLVSAGIGVHYWLGPDFVRDVLTVVFGKDVLPEKPAPPAPKLDPTNGKPEFQEMAKRLTGKWTGVLPKGDKITYEYKEDGQFSIQVEHPGGKSTSMIGGWKVLSVDDRTVRIHRQTFMPPKVDAFHIEATVTFPGADEMEHSLTKGTVKCRREAP
jgi:hypothetical protein